MQASEIRELTDSDIRARITELEEERFRLKFRGATENLEDPLRLRTIRKDVARLKTVLRERELGAGAGPDAAAPAPAQGKGARKRAPKARTSASARTRTAAPKARKQER
jgi:large subunit ribosomal protein L29